MPSELSTADAIATPETGDLLPIRKAAASGLLKITLEQVKDFVLSFLPSVATAGSVVQIEAADYTIAPADVTKYIRLISASAKNVTVEDEATTALPANGEWHFRNVGADNATFVEGTGVVINPPNGGTLVVPQGGTVTLKRAAEDVFDLLGQTVAA